MKSFFNQWVRPAGLFLFGIFMIVWGYMANASNNGKVKEEQNLPKEGEETIRPEVVPARDMEAVGTIPEQKEKGAVPPENALKEEKKKEGISVKKDSAVKSEKTSAPSEKKESAPVVIETEKKAEEASGTE